MPVRETLFSLQDRKYQAFQRKLIPNIDPSVIIGVRTPDLRRLAKSLQNRGSFLSSLPHLYFEENQIHCFLLEGEKDFQSVVSQIEAFLPYVDNWATCDQLRPKVFRNHRMELLPYIQMWIQSSHVYTIRFGIGMLMCHFLDDAFRPEYLEWVSKIHHEDYYVKMMVAWYFATALAKQYDAAFPYLSQSKLDPWIHKKTIQKAIESYRISPSQKEILKQYRIS